ncbi:MAG: alpha/beta hydrolase [Vulcanimicrobiota bacterium]
MNILDHPGQDPPLVLLHGLTANAHSFDGLVGAGLRHRTICVDLRGRGESHKPETGYSLADHARDILNLLDGLNLPDVVLGGHSYGALVSIYLAAHHPERVQKLVLLDIAHEVPGCQQVYRMIRPSVDRLGLSWPNWEEYLQRIRQAPYFAGWWDPQIESYLRADLTTLPDGSVTSKVPAAAILEVLDRMVDEDWQGMVRSISQPALLVHASEPFGNGDDPALISSERVKNTLNCLQQGRLIQVAGNHLTMLYGDAAKVTAQAIEDFLAE